MTRRAGWRDIAEGIEVEADSEHHWQEVKIAKPDASLRFRQQTTRALKL